MFNELKDLFINELGDNVIIEIREDKIAKDITLNAGYSLMFASDSMEVLKGGDKGENNSWAWMMFTFKPKLFSYTAPAPSEE